VTLEEEQTSTTGEVKREQVCTGESNATLFTKHGLPVASVSDGRNPVVDDPEMVIFVEERLLVCGTDLHVMNPFHIRRDIQAVSN
jgi:hypothetical protein